MHILVILGTRPEAIKMAPVIGALRRDTAFRVSVCLTAQHRELLDQVIQTFGLSIDFDLDLMRPNQSIYDVTGSVLLGLKPVLEQARPDAVLVHGDTTTSFAGALAAFYQQIPVGHVEAGLRTRNPYQPFPEEMNRRLADALSTYHYAATESARSNLLQESIPAEHILVTGNTVIDALLDVANRDYAFTDPFLDRLGNDRRLLLVTAHRRESFGPPFQEMCTAIRDLARANPDLEVVYPVHPNPNVRKTVREVLAGEERVHLIDPLDYVPFVHLLKKAHLVLTDSGGIQEEAPSLGKPVLVMREVTERPEAIEAGTALLVGTQYKRILDTVQDLLDDGAAYARIAQVANPYGDGQASARIVAHLKLVKGSRA
ncbi:MAG: UDP-N-acetylglucosamine 2-epimerase (non-hydrolyzing) [Candidatus Hydrogenedentes bacterium]|nr:UDP-N-acetylglucosamine 2-epimerase (non-hydrolyzing) [Candidatus Hydrogenedentota bacterium]